MLSPLRIQKRLRLVLVRFATRNLGRCANLVWSAIRLRRARPECARTQRYPNRSHRQHRSALSKIQKTKAKGRRPEADAPGTDPNLKALSLMVTDPPFRHWFPPWNRRSPVLRERGFSMFGIFNPNKVQKWASPFRFQAWSLWWRKIYLFADDGRSISPDERFILATEKRVGRWPGWHRDGQSLPAPWRALSRYLPSFGWLRRSAIPQLRILREADESAPAESRRKHKKKPRHCSLPGLLSYMLTARPRLAGLGSIGRTSIKRVA